MNVIEEVGKYHDYAVSMRREFHKHPELSWKEVETAGRIRDELAGMGIPYEEVAGTGTIATLKGKEDQPVIGLRCDIDALPIREVKNLPYCSQNQGVMHACGHDAHISMLLTAARVLAEHQDELKCTVKLIFQPAEECNPTGGAKAVIGQGLFEQFGVEEFYGLHMWPELKVGEIAVKPGPIMASSDKLLIRVTGKKAHAAEPQKGVDAISIAAEIINAVEHKIRREISPFETVLISIGSIRTSGRYNIICDQVLIEGTIRSMNPDIRQFVHKRIKELAGNIAAAYRGTTGVTIEDGYAVVDNNRRITEKFINAAGRILGAESVHTDISPSLIGEDFSFYSQKLPSMYFFMGCESEYPLHNEKFLPKESTLDEAITLMAGYFTEFV